MSPFSQGTGNHQEGREGGSPEPTKGTKFLQQWDPEFCPETKPQGKQCRLDPGPRGPPLTRQPSHSAGAKNTMGAGAKGNEVSLATTQNGSCYPWELPALLSREAFAEPGRMVGGVGQRGRGMTLRMGKTGFPTDPAGSRKRTWRLNYGDLGQQQVTVLTLKFGADIQNSDTCFGFKRRF